MTNVSELFYREDEYTHFKLLPGEERVQALKIETGSFNRLRLHTPGDLSPLRCRVVHGVGEDWRGENVEIGRTGVGGGKYHCDWEVVWWLSGVSDCGM